MVQKCPKKGSFWKNPTGRGSREPPTFLPRGVQKWPLFWPKSESVLEFILISLRAKMEKSGLKRGVQKWAKKWPLFWDPILDRGGPEDPKFHFLSPYSNFLDFFDKKIHFFSKMNFWKTFPLGKMDKKWENSKNAKNSEKITFISIPIW